jgi:two-component system phosphate regulon response regulator PhoB
LAGKEFCVEFMYQSRDPMDAGEARANASRVLIVDRDVEAAHSLQTTLAESGIAAVILSNVEEARSAIERGLPDLVMLDWDLPEPIRMSLVSQVARQAPARRTRLLVLSVHSGEDQIVSGFELGIDDYVVKPYSQSEIIARVKAILRTTRMAADHRDLLEFQRLRLDAREGRVWIADRVIPLPPMQFRLLEFLMRHPERVFSREDLLRSVWGHQGSLDPRAVDINVQRVRRALLPHGCQGYVQTVYGVGYRLSASLE